MLIPFGLILPKMTNTTNTQVFITTNITSQKQSNKQDYSLLSDIILVAYLINLNLTFIMKFCHPKKLSNLGLSITRSNGSVRLNPN